MNSPTLGDRLRFLLLGLRDIPLFIIAQRYRSFVWGFSLLPSKYLAWTSRIRARRAYYSARRRVPAYRDFVSKAAPARWKDIPWTDKDNYVRAYPTQERCIGGVIPETGIMIDESSGSTGTPYNWVRSLDERKESHAFISYFSTYCYGEDPWVTINAFSMGAWATGLNMGLALQRNGTVKNTGPDIDKILHTLRFFGPDPTYLITGYPPFLKQLFDTARASEFPWGDYRLMALVGGEGMSEGLRDYLLQGFSTVYSGYGATDLEIGIAGETPVSVAIRRLARDHPDVRTALFGNDSRLPMVFQYNPIMHYVETTEDGELVFTITRRTLLSPRIKYNIHDQGGVMRYDQMAALLQSVGHKIETLVDPPQKKQLHFPFLWVYGRKDFTISIMGANIYPEDLEQCVYADPALAAITRSFCQALSEGADGAVRPAFYFELTVPPSPDLERQFSDSILQHLIELNADFREAWREYPDTLIPEIQLFREGEGPFASDRGKIKQARLLRPRA